MRFNRVLLLAIWSLASWLPAIHADYVQIVSFGDSLSDTGNLYAASGSVFPPAPYYNGRFSNGPVWVESLAGKLGVPSPTPSVFGGSNYAWASAESGAGLSPTFGAPNLLTQVGQFSLKNKLTANQLVTVWAGGNDFLNGQTNPYIPVNNITAAITELASIGGKNFVVPNLPMLDQIPSSLTLPPAEKAALHSLTGAFNNRLKTQLTQLQSDLGVNIYQVDTASLFNQIQSNPTQFGFADVTNSALGNGAFDGKGYLFWDGVHPTTDGHALIADAAFAQATPEPSTFILMATAVLGLATWRRKWQTQKGPGAC